MSGLFEALDRIVKSSSSNLKDLAVAAGEDWKTLFQNQSLAGCDLRGQDLRGMSLIGCNLAGAIIDEKTIIDRDFDPRLEADKNYYARCKISAEFRLSISNYMDEVGYIYAAWAHRSLLETGIRIISRGGFEFYRNIIHENPNLRSALVPRGGAGSTTAKILIENRLQEILSIHGISVSDEYRLREILLVGLISRKIKRNSRKDYSTVPLSAFYPPKTPSLE